MIHTNGGNGTTYTTMVMSRTSTRYDGDICSTTTISVVLLLRIQSKVASKIDNNITVPGEFNVYKFRAAERLYTYDLRSTSVLVCNPQGNTSV